MIMKKMMTIMNEEIIMKVVIMVKDKKKMIMK